MPEKKSTPALEEKKPDVSAKAPGTPPTNEQKSPAAQVPQAAKIAAPAEKKTNDPPKEPPKVSPAPSSPPSKAPQKEVVPRTKRPEDKGKSDAEPKKADTSAPSTKDTKTTVEKKIEEKKSDSKVAIPIPKSPTPAEQKKSEEKKSDDKKQDVTALATDSQDKATKDSKKPNEKAVPDYATKDIAAASPKKGENAPSAADDKTKSVADPEKPAVASPGVDPKGKPADTPLKENAKYPISVSGKDKVEILIAPKPVEQPAAANGPDTKPPTVDEAPLTPAQKGGLTRKENTQPVKDFIDGKATLDGKPIELLQSVPAGKPKGGTSVGPAQQAEGPKGIVITQVFDDRLAPPTEADLKNLPIPKEGEAFSMRLHPAYFFEFLEHPFTINRETKDYKDLYESIKENGIHDPVYVRPREKGGLEIMSGHRRHDIGAQLNYPIPTIIVHADDDTARIAVVDGNLHRMDIPTSELARAAKMKMEALSRKAGRRSKMDQLAAPQKRSDQQVAEDMGMSRNQVQRLVRIDSLVPELKQQVDDKKLPFNTAVELSYMKPEEQQKVVDFMAKEQVTPSMAQATELKEASKHAETLAKYTPSLAPAHKVDEKKIESIMKPKHEPELKITLKGSDLKPYFPGKLPPAQEIKQTIFDALGMHKRMQEKQAKKQEVTALTR